MAVKGDDKKMRILQSACRKYRQFPSGRNFTEYTLIRNEVNSLIREDEDTNSKTLIQGFRGKPKAFTEYMRNLRTVEVNVMSLVKEDGKLTKDDRKAPKLLASYFEEIFTREDSTFR